MTEGPDHSKTLLLGFVNRVKRLLDEIGDLQADVSDVVKEAKSAGFNGPKIRAVAQWLRKIDKDGREKVDEAEAIFDLYRSVVDGKASSLDDLMNDARDRALLKIFAPDDQVDAKLSERTKKAKIAVVMALAAKVARHS